METVWLVEAGIGRNAVEKERIEDGVIAGGRVAIDRIETSGIVLAEIARCEHAGDEDRQAALMQSADELVEGIARRHRIAAAKRVVGAKLDDYRIRIFANRPVYSREAAAERIAGHAGVDNVDIVAACFEGTFQPSREGFVRGKTEAGRQAVSEGDDRQRCGGNRACRGGGADENHGREPKGLDRHGSSTI